jgi:hypothetical protein
MKEHSCLISFYIRKLLNRKVQTYYAFSNFQIFKLSCLQLLAHEITLETLPVDDRMESSD